MKINLQSLGIIILLSFIIGGLSTYCFLSKKTGEIVTIQPVDTVEVVQYRDTTIIADTIYLGGDIIYIDSTTSIGNIPIRTEIRTGEIPIKIGNQGKEYNYQIKYREAIKYRGILYEIKTWTIPETYRIAIPRQKLPPLRFYGNLGVSMDYQKNLLSEGEVGIIVKERIGIFGRGEIKTINDMNTRMGIKIFL